MTITYPGPLIQVRTQVPSRPHVGSRARATLTNTHYINAEHILSTPHGGRVDWSPTGFIAFSVFQTQKYGGEIWTMGSDGTSKVDRTSAEVSLSHISNDQPTVHPAGSYIIFQTVDPVLYQQLLDAGQTTDEANNDVQGGFGIDNNLEVLNLGNGAFHQLTAVSQTEGVLHPHFSPDGLKLFYSGRNRVGGVPQWSLTYADFITGGASPSLANAQLFQPLGTTTNYETHNIEPNGTWGLFACNANPTVADAPTTPFMGNIFKLHFGTGLADQLTHDHNVWNEHAQVSPSGNCINWASSRGNAFTPNANWQNTLALDLWQMDVDGSNPRQITFFNTPGSAQYVAGTRVILSDGSWSADGLHYVMQRDKITAGVDTSEVVVFDFSTAQ